MLHGAGIFTYIWVIFAGQILGLIFQHHGAYGYENFFSCCMPLFKSGLPRIGTMPTGMSQNVKTMAFRRLRFMYVFQMFINLLDIEYSPFGLGKKI